MKRAEHLPTRRGDALAVTLAAAALVLITVLCNALRPTRFDNLEISGSAPFKEQIANSLTMLRNRSPESYGVITSYIGRISQAKHSGMVAYQDPPTLELNDRTVFYSLTWCASSIAHDSIHSKLYNDYRKLHPEGVYAPDEVWTGAEAETKCREHQMRVLQQLRAPLNEIKWLSQTNNRYWEIDYSKRDW
jgi:hypothetical protein